MTLCFLYLIIINVLAFALILHNLIGALTFEEKSSAPLTLSADIDRQLVQLRKDRESDKIEIQFLKRQILNNRMLHNFVADNNDKYKNSKIGQSGIPSSQPPREKRSYIIDPYVLLSAKLEAVKADLESIKLMEDSEHPVLKQDLEKQQGQISELLNLTTKVGKNLRDLQKQKINSRKDVSTSTIVIDYKPSRLERLNNRIWHLEERIDHFEHYMKWNQLWTQRIQNQISILIKNTTDIHKNLEKKIAEKCTANKQQSIERTDYERLQELLAEMNEGSGSGDMSEEFLPILPQNWPALEDLKTTQESARKVLKIQSDLQKQVLLLNKKEKIATKTRKHFETGLSNNFEKINAKIEQISSKLTKSINRTENFSWRSEKRISQVEHTCHQSHKTAQVIKKVQHEHFGAIMNFSRKVNLLETDVTKYGLKLTTLQAEFLNSTLFLHKESKHDYRQDVQLIKLEQRVERCENKFPEIYGEVKLINRKLAEKMTYGQYKELRGTLETGLEKLSKHSSHIAQMDKQLYQNTQSLIKIENQLPNDCSTSKNLWKNASGSAGLQLIKPKNAQKSVFVNCDKTGWTVIQQRLEGLVSFNKTYDQYVQGFGNALAGEDHYIGNEFIYLLTAQHNQSLRIDTWDIFDDYRYAIYDLFRLSNGSDYYRLNIGNYTEGNLTDALSFHQGMQFSAYDRDRDASSTHCARYHHSGWWFSNCQRANLNGYSRLGMIWFDMKNGDWLRLRKSRMLIRPRTI